MRAVVIWHFSFQQASVKTSDSLWVLSPLREAKFWGGRKAGRQCATEGLRLLKLM
jgi:hypothetical protein